MLSEKSKRSEIEKNEYYQKMILFLNENEIDLNWVSNFKQILYHYVNDLKKIPICRCGKKNPFKSYRVGYRKHCSPKCSANSEETKNKLRMTKKEKYGDPNFNNTKKNLETKIMKYGNPNYNNREKAAKTNTEKYGFNTPTKSESVKIKTKKTKLEKYGNENYNNIEKIKEFWNTISDDYKNEITKKVKDTKLLIYQDQNYNNSIKMISTKIERGILRDEKSNMEYKQYRNRVRSQTNSKRKKVLEDWDGFDFYTGEFIRENFKLHYTELGYPTIDHKIPIIVCYKLGLSVKDASKIENLCMTTRHMNSIKRTLIDSEFIEKLNLMN